MTGFLDQFPELNLSLSIYEVSESFNSSLGKVEKSNILLGETIGFYYSGKKAESYISDRYRGEVNGYFVTYLNETTKKAKTNGFISFEDGEKVREFEIVNLDNVGQQNEVLLILVKELV